MKDNVSVSNGVFAHKGAYKIGQKRKKIHNNPHANEPWYQAYKDAWSVIENAAEEIKANMFKQILSDIKNYVTNIRDNNQDEFSCSEISTAILLTGINLPDHDTLFQKLSSKLSSLTKYIAVIPSRDSANMKVLIEETVYQLINNNFDHENNQQIKKNQCNFRTLQTWYLEKCKAKTPLVIIIPDFESFNSSILHDFILVLSSYSTAIKFVLIFGVATTLHAVHRSLSYDVTSKLRVQVFHTQTQMKSLSDVLEGTVLSGKSSFMLTGRAFQLLTDIFIFYDFSVNGFLQGYKLCMLQHFFGNNLASLCCHRSDIKFSLKKLTIDDLKELQELPSIAKYFEKNKSLDACDDKKLRSVFFKILHEFHDFKDAFFVILKCLHSLTMSLPGTLLGKQLREVYSSTVTSDLLETKEYKDSIQYLNFMSKEEIIVKLKNFIKIINDAENDNLQDVSNNLQKHLDIIRNASLEIKAEEKDNSTSPNTKLKNRSQFLGNLKYMSQKQSRSPFKQAQIDLLNYLNDKIFGVYLENPGRLSASEIFCFSDANAGKQHLRGSLRAAIHMGFNNPQVYINCHCCKLENDQVIPATLPDLSITYKLHLESRKLINMYDWLQSFLMIINPRHESEQTEIHPEIQARFTRVVAELQFLGFIKTSRKKTDHVKRLT